MRLPSRPCRRPGRRPPKAIAQWRPLIGLSGTATPRSLGGRRQRRHCVACSTPSPTIGRPGRSSPRYTDDLETGARRTSTTLGSSDRTRPTAGGGPASRSVTSSATRRSRPCATSPGPIGSARSPPMWPFPSAASIEPATVRTRLGELSTRPFLISPATRGCGAAGPTSRSRRTTSIRRVAPMFRPWPPATPRPPPFAGLG